MTKLERGIHDTEALAVMATRNGYRSLGWKEGGSLTPGSPADFTTIGLDSVRLAGADPANALPFGDLYAATSADVHHLVVGGRPVVVGGNHVSIDVASELGAIIPKLMTS